MSELIERLVGKTLNLPKEQLAEILYESDGTTIKSDAVDKLIEIDAQRIATIKQGHKDELTRMHDDTYSKAQGEVLAKYEKKLKEELGLQTDAKGIDLIKEAIAKNTKIEIDEDKIKLSPLYLELERKLNNEYLPKAEYDKVKAEFDQFKDQIEVTKVNSVVKQDALKVFRSFKPVLSKDPVKATNQESDFVNKLISFDYELQDDGNHIIKVNGKRVETANGYPVSFADFVKSEASKYYDFEQQDNRQNAGNNNSGNNGTSVTVPQTEREYLVLLANEPDPAKQVSIMNAWKAKNAK